MIYRKISLKTSKFHLKTLRWLQKNSVKKIGVEVEDIGRHIKENCYIADANNTVVAKRWDNKFEDEFRTELDIQFKHKHKHIIGLVGYCNEMDEKIIVYEHTSKGSLDIYLKHSTLKWMERLRICIDIASALEFLHEGDVMLNKVVHRDINSHSIFLNDAWVAKISNFELDSLSPDMKHINDDPQYKQGLLIGKSDIYSFGVILFEILCGGLAWVEGGEGNKSQSLATLARHCYEQEKVDEMVFEGIKKQIVPQSLATFVDIGYECLHEDGHERPEAIEVTIQLKKALEFQEDYEVWECKLPEEYEEIIQLSEKPDIYHTEKKKDIYKKLYNGILIATNKDIYKKLYNGILNATNKVWFKLSENGEANKMISATMFSYENRESHKWRSLHKSRFRAVAQMLDISNLKIQITIDTQFLSPNVAYGVYMVFKFCDPNIFPSTRMYMNMEYRNGAETLHSYFATWRDDEWMMIELYRFVNHKDDVVLKFLLDSFSRYYCRSGAIYFEGVEFRAIKNVAREDIKNLGAVQRPTVNEEIFKRSEPDNMDDKTQLYTSIELNGKKHLMLSAKKVLRNSPPKLEPFRFIPSADSRFQDVAELLPEQIFRINYKIETQMLSPFTEYACYLVFKVSKKSRGLYCPVKVRDLLHRNKKENKIIYFRSPAPLNQHDAFGVPKQREDGWMEVMVWNFNSKYDKLEKNYIPMNLKLITYEGTMSGLIICGLEFRPT
ncbi:hypothetical protein SSX86_011488 [Deinandra increscens subsp. villosa]|uniref:Protein kinase domain-containing protein n=1 Tax=Deinandra increscens subsp. villosa TaxID=3103831 RepID=A0AAP0H206_9ASTR